MKRARKFINLILALVMVMSLSITTMAETKITIDKGATGSEYAAYRLLNATDGGDGKFAYTLNQKYKNILLEVTKVEENENGEAKTDAAIETEIINHIKGLDTTTEIRTFANAVYAAIKNANQSIAPDAISDNNEKNEITVNTQGYYLIAETQTGTWGEGESEDTYSLVMLDTAGKEAITVETKEERPTLKKEITDDDNAIQDGEGKDIDIADDKKSNNLSVGSKVEFTLTATIPAEAAQYDYYYFIISDKLSDGLTFINDNEKPLSVSATPAEGNSAPLTKDRDYVLYTGTEEEEAEYADGKTFQVALKDAKSLAGQTITVIYWAELNDDAVIGDNGGNTNTATLEYSNDPNTKYDETQGDDTPGKPDPDEIEDELIGETPGQETATYTTGIKIKKVDGGGKSLTGAEFQIKGDNVKYVLVSKDVFEPDDNGDYYELEGGTYTKEAPREQDEYVETPDATSGWVEIDDEEWVEYDAENSDHQGKIVHTKRNKNDDQYVKPYAKYSKTTEFETVGDDSEELNVKAFVDADGILYFNGLGEGEYTITETTVPEGYNKIDDITVTIEWNDNPEAPEKMWTATVSPAEDGEEDLDFSKEEGVFVLTVENLAGTELPSTGGIGTTIFYVAGGILVLVAVVLLVTKKRMKADE